MEKYKNIGLVVAIEIEAVLNKYKSPLKKEKIDAYDVITYKINHEVCMYVVKCGPGEIASAAATQFCISKLGCELIVNFGIVGGLTKEMSDIKTCVVEKVVHYDYDTTFIDKDYVVGQYNEYSDAYIPVCDYLVDKACEIEPSLKRVIVASGDKFVGDNNKKRELNKQFGADICEMECAGIALTCNRNNVPFLMIKCVSDGCEAGENDFYTNFKESATTCFEVTDKIIKMFCC